MYSYFRHREDVKFIYIELVSREESSKWQWLRSPRIGLLFRIQQGLYAGKED